MREKSEAWAVAAAVGWSFPATVQLATEAKMEAKAKVRQLQEKLRLERVHGWFKLKLLRLCQHAYGSLRKGQRSDRSVVGTAVIASALTGLAGVLGMETVSFLPSLFKNHSPFL